MVYCIGMFVLGVVALTARGLYFDIFRLTEWGSVFVFLPAALLLFLGGTVATKTRCGIQRKRNRLHVASQ
ncbi:hypothetical protein [Exiguobacterium sp. s166]|uniref:hypothetical protein n=1 Tax=Exiguobacterium sp. s166 TaxID=2751204 RepID=UPI001BE69678|nr:hypothetical protein [Exiguobacterium sp. s166]